MQPNAGTRRHHYDSHCDSVGTRRRTGNRRQAAGSHESWHHPATNRYTTIPNHPGDMPEGTLRAIFKQAGIEPEAFLQKK
jgi:hypothetical protein